MTPETTDPLAGREVVTVPDAAELLDTSRVQVHRLIEDWAFGDPAKLPNVGVARSSLRIPVGRLRAFIDRGEREYPPGDPRRAAPCPT